MNANNLRMHLNSKLHKVPVVQCFGAPACGREFITISDMILHIENGHCVSGLTRAALRKYVLKADRNNIITNPARMIADSSNNNGPRNGMYATEKARNSDGYYECILCPRIFTSLSALNRHYGSSAHESKVFRCPNHNSGCPKHFKTLAGVIQHMEDGYCGARDSRYVQDRVNDLMRDMGKLRLTY